jgi:hypothetical protein
MTKDVSEKSKVIKYRRSFFSMEEHLHERNDSIVNSKNDIIYILGTLAPYGEGYYERPTLLIDLTPGIEDVFKQFSATTKNEINQMIRADNCRYHMIVSPTDKEISKYGCLFNDFAQSINIKTCDVNYLAALNRNGYLYISLIEDKDGAVVIMHFYRVSNIRPELLYSYRSKTHNDEKQNSFSKLNRYCHWQDICYFAKEGFRNYDFGGFYHGTDEKQLNVNSFKLSFGGSHKVLYNSIIYNTPKAKIFKFIKKIAGK